MVPGTGNGRLPRERGVGASTKGPFIDGEVEHCGCRRSKPSSARLVTFSDATPGLNCTPSGDFMKSITAGLRGAATVPTLNVRVIARPRRSTAVTCSAIVVPGGRLIPSARRSTPPSTTKRLSDTE